MTLAVKKLDGTVDIITDNGTYFNLRYTDYRIVRSMFDSQGILLHDLIISPTAIINYLEERNPLLLDAEVQIENEKVRRREKNAAYDFAKWAVPFCMIIMASVIAYKMLSQGDVSGATEAATTAANSVSPVVIK